MFGAALAGSELATSMLSPYMTDFGIFQTAEFGRSQLWDTDVFGAPLCVTDPKFYGVCCPFSHDSHNMFI